MSAGGDALGMWNRWMWESGDQDWRESRMASGGQVENDRSGKMHGPGGSEEGQAGTAGQTERNKKHSTVKREY